MTINATVLEVYDNRLLVRDLSNNQEIMVNYRGAQRFSPGDVVRITYNSQMTFSLPPQITAVTITKIQPPAQPPSSYSELRAVVIGKSSRSLLVRELNTNNQFTVDYRYSGSIRVGQRIVIQYETIFLNEPPRPSRIIAINILPMN